MKHEDHPSRLGLGIAICLLGFIFFATASSLVFSFRGRFSTIQIIFIQNFVSFLCILPFHFKKGIAGLKTSHFPIHLIRDIMGVLSYYLYFVAIRYLNLVDATTLNYTAPFFVPLFWWIWMKERVAKNAWISIVVGFFGAALILNPTKEIFELGFVFGLFAGIASAVAFCAIRILNLKMEPARRVLFYYFSMGTILSFPFAIIYWIPPSPIEWAKAIGIGVATSIGQLMLTVAYRYGTAAYLSPLGYSTVIYTGLISYFLFDKPLSLRTAIGAALIVLSGTATYLLKKKPHTLKETFQTSSQTEKPPI